MRMKFLKASLAFIATFVLTWLMAGLIAWDWNPANWEPIGRLGLVWIASGFGGFAAAAALGEKK
jgi:hypothetical protein